LLRVSATDWFFYLLVRVLNYTATESVQRQGTKRPREESAPSESSQSEATVTGDSTDRPAKRRKVDPKLEKSTITTAKATKKLKVREFNSFL
jgi:hypothetical protein